MTRSSIAASGRSLRCLPFDTCRLMNKKWSYSRFCNSMLNTMMVLAKRWGKKEGDPSPL